MGSDFECVVIGAGIVGLAVARRLSFNFREVLVLEKNKTFGLENSSRNSGVIHAGIYYKKKSLKSIFCKKGNEALYKYACERKIDHNKCGKLIIAQNESEDRQLLKLKKNATQNGVSLKKLNKNQISMLEPELKCFSALYSPTTGIIDINSVMLNFVADIENNNGRIVYNNKIKYLSKHQNTIKFTNDKKTSFTTKILINCAGLHSHNLAKSIDGMIQKSIPKVTYVKGNYFKLEGKSPFKKLIYPLPTSYGLGIHSTINLSNQTIFGPDEEIVRSIDYSVNKNKKKDFIENIRQFWPEIINKTITEDYSGIRTKVRANDFIIEEGSKNGVSGLINLYGIESPGLTSCLQIGEYVNTMCKKYLKKNETKA